MSVKDLKISLMKEDILGLYIRKCKLCRSTKDACFMDEYTPCDDNCMGLKLLDEIMGDN